MNLGPVNGLLSVQQWVMAKLSEQLLLCRSDILGSKFRMESFVEMSFQSEQSANNFNLAPLAAG